MSSKQARGTKRTCQSHSCGVRFYDLNRDPILCPVCGTEYVIASAPGGIAAAADKGVRKTRKDEYGETGAAAPGEVVVAEGDEVLAEAVDAGEEPIAPEADDAFIEEEEEEDGGDVSNILGAPVSEDEGSEGEV